MTVKKHFSAIGILLIGAAVLASLQLVYTLNETNSSQLRYQKIQRSIDVNTFACDNFFRYACGKWSETANTSHVESLEQVELNTNGELQNIFESEDLSGGPKFLANVYYYYLACRDIKHTPHDGTAYLKWLNVHHNFKWPLVLWDSTAEDFNWSYDWFELLAMTRRFGFNELFFRQEITHRLDEPHEMIIEFKRPSLKVMENTWSFLIKYRISSFKEIFENLSEFNQELFEASSELFPIQEDAENFYDDESELVTLRDLQMPWLEKYLCVLLNQSDVDPNMQLYMQSVDYMKNIFMALSAYDNSLVCDYIHLHFYMFLAHRDTYRQRDDCVASARLQFPMALHWFYGQRHAEVHQELPVIRDIFENLKRRFNKTLQRNTYQFSTEILEHLEQKLKRIELVSAEDIKSEALQAYYKGLQLSAADYHGNILKLNNFKYLKTLEALKMPVNNSKALEYLDISPRPMQNELEALKQAAQTHLPQLYPRLNVIFLPLSLIQYPYYGSHMHDMYIYSSLGYHLARELLKAFDLRNVEIGPDGVYNYDMGDEIFDYQKFDSTSRRLKADFAMVHEVDEVIADLGGLKLAYETFVERHADILHQQVFINKRSMMVKHVFFLNYAHNFCNSNCSASVSSIRKYDACSRVNVPATRFGKFRFGFQCRKKRKWGYPLWR